MVVVNFKAYKSGTGQQALQLAQACQRVKDREGVEIILLPQTADLYRLSQSVNLSVWSQHVDPVGSGAHTGAILPETIKAAGATGTILNHAERKIPLKVIGETAMRVKKIGLTVLVCCDSLEEAREVALLRPDYLAYEPPELIGNRKTSVAAARPGVIADFVKQFSALPIVVGAGIHSADDVRVSLRLGAKGILVASDVVLAKDPEKELTELARGFDKN